MTNPNDSVYPLNYETILEVEKGFWYGYGMGKTKYEEAHLRFMCAFVSNPEMVQLITVNSAPNIAETATILTNAYFQELNKEK
jgi:hypothetical protein